MKVAQREFTNVYGYPTLNAQIYKALKDKYLVVIGVESLFSKNHKPAKDQITVVIDGFAKLRSTGTPIIGYTATPSMVYVKGQFSERDLVPNTVTITHPFYLNGSKSSARPTISMLIAFNKCRTPEDYKALQSKYVAELKDPKLPKFKWLRRVINQALKGDEEKDE